MKKKGLLGILAVLMVFALALTGCGQQGEQNAGATGSESQNGTITDNGNANNGEATAELEKPADEADNRRPEMRDGRYVYEVLGEEFLCETNVWDYIDEDAGTFDFLGMQASLGLDGDYCIGRRAFRGAGLKGGDISEIHFDIITFENEERIKVVLSEEKLYHIVYLPTSIAVREYASKSDSRYGFTFDTIVLVTYGTEHLKENFDSLPLGDHLLDYYNEQNMTYELP